MSGEQFRLFEPDRADVELAYLQGRLDSATSDAERKGIEAELEALRERSKPGAVWNGKIWASDDDLPF